MDAARPARGAEVLEIGCGAGETARLIAETYSCRVTGIDKSRVNIARAIAENNHPGSGCAFMIEDADDVHCGGETVFAKEYFDVVYAECVISLSDDSRKLVGKIYDTLAPGGRFAALDVCERSGGAADLITLNRYARDAGFTKIYGEDMSGELASWVAEKIMNHGSLDAYFQSVTPAREDASAYCGEFLNSKRGNIGYAVGVYIK
jgi:SAM-dependent methyltransferase